MRHIADGSVLRLSVSRMVSVDTIGISDILDFRRDVFCFSPLPAYQIIGKM